MAALLDATRRTVLDECRRILERDGASVQCVDERGNTPLHLAVLKSSFAITRLLLQYGADPRVCNHAGVSIMDIAGQRKSQRIMGMLQEYVEQMDQGAEEESEPFSPTAIQIIQPHNTYIHRQHVLLHACRMGNMESVLELASKGTSFLCNDMFLNRPLHLAAAEGHSSLCQYLIETIGVCRNPLNVHGETPVHRAIRYGHMTTSLYLAQEAYCSPFDEIGLAYIDTCKNKTLQRALMEKRAEIEMVVAHDMRDRCVLCSTPISLRFGDDGSGIPVCGPKITSIQSVTQQQSVFLSNETAWRRVFLPTDKRLNIFICRFGILKEAFCGHCQRAGVECTCMEVVLPSSHIVKPHSPRTTKCMALLLYFSKLRPKQGDGVLHRLESSPLFDMELLRAILQYL